MKVTLYYFEFVPNGLGIWDRMWSLTEGEAKDDRANLVGGAYADYYTIVEDDELDGTEGQVSGIRSIEVELTPEGLRNFANRFAVDQCE